MLCSLIRAMLMHQHKLRSFSAIGVQLHEFVKLLLLMHSYLKKMSTVLVYNTMLQPVLVNLTIYRGLYRIDLSLDGASK